MKKTTNEPIKPTPTTPAVTAAEETVATLQQQIRRLEQEKVELALKLAWYEEKFRLSQQKRFGASSERTNAEGEQLRLFDEPELVADPAVEEPTMETITIHRKKKQGDRDKKLKELPVEIVTHELPEGEQSCPQCRNHLTHDEYRHSTRIEDHPRTGDRGGTPPSHLCLPPLRKE